MRIPRAAAELRRLGVIRDPHCIRCSLHGRAHHVCIAGTGIHDQCDVMLVGENPGATEDLEGCPFVGKSGKWLHAVLQRVAGGTRYFLTNAVRCVSPTDEGKFAAVDRCNVYLENEIRTVRPRVILALGATAARALLGVQVPILSVHGGYGWYALADQFIPVVLTVHPAAVLRARALERWFTRDLETAIALSRPGAAPRFGRWQDTVVQVVDTTAAALCVLDAAKQQSVVALDVETHGKLHTDGLQILCCALAWSPDQAYVITEAVLPELLPEIQELFYRDGLTLVAHGAKYDACACLGDRGIQERPLDHSKLFDTLTAWRVARQMQGLDAGLETVAWMVGMGGYYEFFWQPFLTLAARKNRLKIGEAYAYAPRAALYRYCGFDSLAAFRAYTLLAPVVAKIPAWAQFYRPADPVAISLEAEGYPISQSALLQVQDALGYKLQMKLLEIAANPHVQRGEKAAMRAHQRAQTALLVAAQEQGRKPQRLPPPEPFNPGSNKQVAQLLFERLRLKVVKRTATRQISVDEEVLAAVKDKHPVAGLITDYRALKKLQGTYAEAIARLVRPDGRIHAAYKTAGTATGRWSAGGTPGERFNPQTIPSTETEDGKLIRSLFCAPAGWKIVCVDLSQIEIRMACYLSGDSEMLRKLQSGQDFHQLTAAAVESLMRGTAIRPEEVTPEQRYRAKRVNFGVIYGQTEASLAAELAISEEAAAQLRRTILGLHRGLKRWIDNGIREAVQTSRVPIYWQGVPVMYRFVPEMTATDRGLRGHGTRVSINSPIQGSSAFLTTATLIEMHKRLRPPLRSRIITTTHDDIEYLCPDDEVDRVARLAKQVAESWGLGAVPVVANVTVGQSLASLAEYEFLPSEDGARA